MFLASCQRPELRGLSERSDNVEMIMSIQFYFITIKAVQFQFEMVVLKVLREFAGGTSIHGFTFLVRPESSSGTKIIWTICLAVALTYATLEMRNSVVGKYDYITKFIC